MFGVIAIPWPAILPSSPAKPSERDATAYHPLVLRSGAIGDASRRTFQLTPTAAPAGSSFETPALRAPQDEVVGKSGAALGSYSRPQMAPEAFENVQSAPADGAHCRARSMTAPRPGQRPGPTGGMESGAEAAADTSPPVQAPPTSPATAPERIDSDDDAPRNDAVAEALTQLERELLSGLYALPSVSPYGVRRVNLRATPNGVMAA